MGSGGTMKSCRNVPLTVDISRKVGRTVGPCVGGVVGARETVGRRLGAEDVVGLGDTVGFTVGTLVGDGIKSCGAGVGLATAGAILEREGPGAANGVKVILVTFWAAQIEKSEKSQTSRPPLFIKSFIKTKHSTTSKPGILRRSFRLGRFVAFLHADRTFSFPRQWASAAVKGNTGRHGRFIVVVAAGGLPMKFRSEVEFAGRHVIHSTAQTVLSCLVTEIRSMLDRFAWRDSFVFLFVALKKQPSSRAGPA
jgi:hypothetical protein